MMFSRFGQKFTTPTGILQLMEDLGRALAGDEPTIMLGGGNPAAIPAVQVALRQQMLAMLDDEESFERMVGNYSPPQGDVVFIRELAALLRREYGWPIGPEHIALTNGSQTAFFYLFNLFGGEYPDGTRRRILLPLAPEYIGYADVGMEEDLFVAHRPDIEHLDDRLFKYRVHFDGLTVGPDIGAICVSRPTNPTGNVLTDEEIEHLSALAREAGVPFIMDNAYGAPFPAILFGAIRPVWDEHIVLCMSLSKLGLPGARTGIVIARPDIIQAIASLNAIFSLAPGNTGAALALEWVRSGAIIRLSEDVIRPFYAEKARHAVAQVRQAMGTGREAVPCHIHKPEGAFFLWLWFPELPITAAELYERLKRRRVIVVPGHYFFPGLQEEWRHKHECLRVSYAQDDSTVAAGIHIIAEEVRRAYAEG
ncbi:MAG: valine--pyruvate transaminase [Caldilineales bacterium]|nr:valine--pyruvate transaminase [Caldilineales bacterium]